MNELQHIESSAVSGIRSRIYEVRGVRVMLDFDLAKLYQVETRVLKQTVRRHLDRFPEDFMLRLTKDEANQLILIGVSQNVIPQGYNPGGSNIFAFTEHGVLALAYVLKSQVAVQMGHAIVRTFVAMRETLNKVINTNLQIENIRAELANQRLYIEDILRDQNDTNADVQAQLDAISQSLAELQSEVVIPPHRTVVEEFGKHP